MLRDTQGAPVMERLGTTRCAVGENPLWHAEERCLYWCDILRGLLLRYDPAIGEESRWQVGKALGGFTIQQNGDLLLFMDRGRVGFWHAGELTIVIPELVEERSSRFNDVIADPSGRVLCGTMSTAHRKGRLYRLDIDGSIHVLLEDIGCPNGMAFSHDFKTLFFTDSAAGEIYRFSYDVVTGRLSNRSVFVRIPKEDGVPDGATIDTEGYLWSARWDGGCIVRYAMDGTVNRIVRLPVNKVASLTFGGVQLDEMYISTASLDEADPVAGSLFRSRASIRGIPECRSRVVSKR